MNSKVTLKLSTFAPPFSNGVSHPTLIQLTCWDGILVISGFSPPGHVTSKGSDQSLSHAALMLMAWGGIICFNLGF